MAEFEIPFKEQLNKNNPQVKLANLIPVGQHLKLLASVDKKYPFVE